MVAIAQLVGVVRLLGDEGTRAAFSADQVNAQVMTAIAAFSDIWYVSKFMFRAPPAPAGLPRPTDPATFPAAVLLAIAGLSYAADISVWCSPRSPAPTSARSPLSASFYWPSGS